MTLRDRMRSEEIRRELRVESTTARIRTARLRWYGHVRRMEENNWEMEVDGRRARGRPVLRWMDNIRQDIRVHGLRNEDAQDRTLWRRMMQTPDPDT